MIYFVNMDNNNVNDRDDILCGIKNYVERTFKVSLLKNTRKRNVVYARALYFKLAREHSFKNLDEIGAILNKDHSTVIHAINNTFPTLYMYEEKYRDAYMEFNIANDVFNADYLISLREKLNHAEDLLLKVKGFNEAELRKAI